MLNIQKKHTNYIVIYRFLSKQMEVNKCKKHVCNLFNKKKYVAHINTLKQALNH